VSSGTRPATPADIPAITAIYAHHVRTGLATFELDPPAEAEMLGRFHALAGNGMPYLVAHDGDRVLGYAYAGPYRPRPAYRFTVEDSIYVDPAAIGQGVGRQLLLALVDASAAIGMRQMVAVIGDSANAASIGVHRRCGFVPVGTLASVGFKFGRWVDSVFMQRPLGAGDTELPAAGT
jgi:phosphinothricin acetyltransferase